MEHMADIAAQMVYDEMPAIRFEHTDGVFVVTIGANMEGGITIDIEDIRNNPIAYDRDGKPHMLPSRKP